MKKNTMLTSLLLILVMAVTIVFTGCGGPETLEEYIANDAETSESIDSLAESSGMTIDITGNTLTYTYAYDQTFDEATIAERATYFESAMDSLASTFENLGTTLEEQTGIEDITVKVVYQDGAGTEIYAAEY